MKWSGLRPIGVALTAVAILMSGPSAQAQQADAAEADPQPTEEEERAAARELYSQGAAAFESGDFEEALARFQACYDMSRLSALLFNIGSAYDRLSRPDEAVSHYNAYLAAVPEADNREYVESRIILLQAQIDATQPDPVADPTTPPGTELPRDMSPPPPPPPSGPSRVGPIVLLATGGAAAVGAVVTGILARGSRSDLDDACNAGICPPEARTTHDAMKRQALLTDILGGVALGLVTAGVLWWVLQPSGEDEDQAQVELGCSFQACNARVQW